MELPLEIRQLIYRHLFADVLPELVLCMCCKSTTTVSKRLNVDVLATCHQLRAEALPVFHDTLTKTRLSLKYETAPFHGRPRPMCGHTMLKSFGSFFREMIIDAEDARGFLAMLPHMTGLQKLTNDYGSPSRPTACIFSGLDRKERYLDSEYDHWSWGVWRNVSRKGEHHGKEWKKILHDYAEDRPSFQVSVLVVYNIGSDLQGDPPAIEELVSYPASPHIGLIAYYPQVSLLDLGSNKVIKKWFKSAVKASTGSL